MTTLPFTLGPTLSSATCRIFGMSSNVPSLGIPSTSYLLSDVNLRFAIAEDIVAVEDEPSVWEQGL